MTTLKNGLSPSLLIIDEPTTGLHLEDVNQLMNSLQSIVDAGHSLLIVEHHPHVLAQADWIFEMGPNSGKKGGKLVASGPPEKIAEHLRADHDAGANVFHLKFRSRTLEEYIEQLRIFGEEVRPLL